MITKEIKEKFIRIEEKLQHLVDLVDSIPNNSKTDGGKWVNGEAKTNGYLNDPFAVFLDDINGDIDNLIQEIHESDK